MDALLIAAAALAVGAGVAALSLADGAVSLVAVFAALVLAAPLSWPLPLPTTLAIRLLGATAAVAPAFLAVRRHPATLAVSPLGPIALFLAALAMGIVAALVPGVGHPAPRAAGAALLILALPALLTATDVLRAGTAGLLALAGGFLLTEGLAGTSGAWVSVAGSAALAAVGVVLAIAMESDASDPAPPGSAPSAPASGTPSADGASGTLSPGPVSGAVSPGPASGAVSPNPTSGGGSSGAETVGPSDSGQ